MSSIYRKLGLDKTQARKLQTGSPDGGLGSIEILLGKEKHVAIVDGVGCPRGSLEIVRHVDDVTRSWILISQRVRLWSLISRDEMDIKEMRTETLIRYDLVLRLSDQ